jgi:hypothetical protein
MYMKHWIVSLILLLSVSIVVVFAFQFRANNDDAVETFTVDVAQDLKLGKYVQNNVAPRVGDDFGRGDTAIVDGTIYPAGSIASGSNSDPKASGIGKYHWVGTWAVSLADFEAAVKGATDAPPILAFATEQFDLPDNGTSLITEGIWPNVHFTLRRPVVGGTGNFRDMVGETRVENIGENSTGGCNLRVTFILRKAKADHGP